MLDRLRERFRLRKVVFVVDSGLFNKDNLDLLEQAGYEYIVGARLKNLPAQIQKKVTNPELYQALDEGLKTQTIDLQANRRLIVSHSETRAHKDQHDRLKALEKLRKKLSKNKNPESLISNYGYKKYLKIEGHSKVVLNEAKLHKDEQWDGLRGVITNASELTVSEILSHYQGLWQVEETFRLSKHDLKIRPVYHWTPSRIRAHIAICYMALCCVRYLEYRVKRQYEKLSPEVIKDNLLSVQASILVHKPSGKKYLMPSSTRKHAAKIYQTMGLKLSSQAFSI
jgi:transposase